MIYGLGLPDETWPNQRTVNLMSAAYDGSQPAHYGLRAPPTSWPEAAQARWLADFSFMAGTSWNAAPLAWYASQLGDA